MRLISTRTRTTKISETMGEEFQAMTEKLDRIERLSLIAAKPVLLVDEAAIFTGFSVQHLYRLTSAKQIPHYKKDRKLYFKKSELEEWMTETPCASLKDINSQAATYCSTRQMR